MQKRLKQAHFTWIVVSEATISAHATQDEAEAVAHAVMAIHWPVDAGVVDMPDNYHDAQRLLDELNLVPSQLIDVRTLSLPTEPQTFDVHHVSQEDKEAIALVAYQLGASEAFHGTYMKHMDTFGGLVGMLERSAEWALQLDVQVKARGIEWGHQIEWCDAIDELVYRFIDNPLTLAAAAAGSSIDRVMSNAVVEANSEQAQGTKA